VIHGLGGQQLFETGRKDSPAYNVDDNSTGADGVLAGLVCGG
jgi:hypothetical protein